MVFRRFLLVGFFCNKLFRLPKNGRTWPQDGPKIAPKRAPDPPDRPKLAPRAPQDAAREALRTHFLPSLGCLGGCWAFFFPKRGQDSPKMAPKRPQKDPKMDPNGPQNGPQKARCLQKSLATRLPAIQERLPAKLVADLPAGTACNNFLDGGRTLREAVTIIMKIIIYIYIYV